MNFLIAVMAAVLLVICSDSQADQLNDLDNELLDNTIPETDATDLASSSPSVSSGRPIVFDWIKITESPPPKVLHPLGTSVELECEATGSPTPTISWVRGKNAHRVLDSYASNALATRGGSPHSLVRVRSRLIIDRTDPAPYEYSCVAQSGGKHAMATTVVYGPMAAALSGQLKVAPATVGDESATVGYTLHANRLAEGLRKPRIVSYYNVIFEMMGNDVFLPCSAVGSPTPDVFWLDNEDRIVGSAGQVSSTLAAASGSRLRVNKAGELMISALKWSDMGTYRCVARSPIGKDVTSVFVYPVLN